MKSVVITGSARGLGFCMAKLFREADYNVVISDLFEDKLVDAKNELEKIDSNGKILYKVCNVTKSGDIEDLNDLYKLGTGFKRGQGFGYIDLIE